MSQLLQPARVTPPGRILGNELEARGWTQHDLATIMGRPVQAINEIVRGVKQITPETAIELAAALDTSPEFWINLETNYRLFLVRKEKGNSDGNEIARKRRLYELAPVTELGKRGWIHLTKDIDELEREVCRFLGIASPEETPQLMARFRCATERDLATHARLAWLRRVEHLAAQQHVAAFRLEQLREALPMLRGYASQAEHVTQVPAFLQELGLHIVLVPHLPKTSIDGAAFYLDDHPVIALSLRYDRIDAFWFTLMHELAHIVLGHTGLYVDEKLDDPEGQLEQVEIEANKQASDWLIDPARFEAFVNQTRPHFSEFKIEQFAAQQGVHPGIVEGRLHYQGVVHYNHLRKLLVKVKPLLEPWIDVPTPLGESRWKCRA